MPLSEPGLKTGLSTWRWFGLAAMLLALLLVGLGRAPLFDVDEGAFSEATREILSSADWGHTTLHGADRFDKPIGVYWLQAASASVFGLNEWAVRLPSALAKPVEAIRSAVAVSILFIWLSPGWWFCLSRSCASAGKTRSAWQP